MYFEPTNGNKLHHFENFDTYELVYTTKKYYVDYVNFQRQEKMETDILYYAHAFELKIHA